VLKGARGRVVGGGGGGGADMAARDVRKAMADEVRANEDWYVAASAGLVSAERLRVLVANVVRPGLSGFWLGSEAGVLEIVMVARALNICIALYCFDIPTQQVRRYESGEVPRPDFEVCLLFTGPAASGHFDLLVRVSESGDAAVPAAAAAAPVSSPDASSDTVFVDAASDAAALPAGVAAAERPPLPPRQS
jgi:hypothetical protein